MESDQLSRDPRGETWSTDDAVKMAYSSAVNEVVDGGIETFRTLPFTIDSSSDPSFMFPSIKVEAQKMLSGISSRQLCSPIMGQTVVKRFAGSAEKIFRINKKGDREVVGFGINGKEIYVDNTKFPFPAIKFRESTPEFKALEEKAKGDWKKLTLAEKKQLYRINYCQTFAEMNAPTGEWKSVVGFGLIAVSLGVWLYMFVEYQRIKDGRVITLSEDRLKAQLRRILDLAINPIDGISSKWDYDKNMWKKDVAKMEKEK